VAALQAGKVDAVVGYSNNEPIILAENGYPVNVFDVADYVDMVANGLLTNEKTISQNPALIRGMVRALSKGIADTISDPAAAMQISTKYVEGLKADDAIQKEVLSKTIVEMQGGKPGESTVAAWTNTQDALLTTGQVQKKMDVNTFFTNEFLP
jgi:NitT/TauT family transport system substrate-binding protein